MLEMDKIGEFGGPASETGAPRALMRAAWPRRGAASNQCGRIRNAEKRIHASGLDREEWNAEPGLDMPEQIAKLLVRFSSRRA